jgi:hypothetical protein
MAIHEVINSNKEQEHFDQDYVFYTFPHIQYVLLLHTNTLKLKLWNKINMYMARLPYSQIC